MTAPALIETHFPPGRALTWEDLQTIPDDEYWRYQLLGGSLVVSPAPSSAHQSCVLQLARILQDARPPDLAVKVAPFDVVPRPGESYQPDVLVARRADIRASRIEAAPVLVAEVLSPSSRALDLGAKRLLYAAVAVEHYWVVDPDVPSVTALRRAGGDYETAARAEGDTPLRADAPFPVTVVPARLLDE